MNRAPPIAIYLEGGEISGGLISAAGVGKLPCQLERKSGSSTANSICFPSCAQGANIVTASTYLVHSRQPLELNILDNSNDENTYSASGSSTSRNNRRSTSSSWIDSTGNGSSSIDSSSKCGHGRDGTFNSRRSINNMRRSGRESGLPGKFLKADTTAA